MEPSDPAARPLVEDEREAKLIARGAPPETWSPRLRHALDLAAGRRKLYLQQPTAFTYPGLPQVQFYETGQFDWVPAIEAAAPAIREELLALVEQGTEFSAYIHGHTEGTELGANQALLASRDWSVLFLCENGWIVPKVIECCPRTWQAVLQSAPLPRVAGWGPTVVFSMLKAGARIAPHTGMYNSRLICHLPLVVPPGCGFRVGNEVRAWEEGKLLIFDDTIEHEAWNDGAEDRIVLIFDIWRPELTEQEKRELTLLFSD
jgi:aspartyl/asparaginyl beta-hydroxylase (cupin superfamily)